MNHDTCVHGYILDTCSQVIVGEGSVKIESVLHDAANIDEVRVCMGSLPRDVE